VVAALALLGARHARLLEQVVTRVRANDAAPPIEVHLDQLAKAGGVVVARCLGVAEGFEHGVGVEQNLFHCHLLEGGGLGFGKRCCVGACDLGKEAKDLLSVLGLAGARLP